MAPEMRFARCGATSVYFAPLCIALGIVLLEGAQYEPMQGAVVDDEYCLVSIHSLVVVFETFLATTPYLTARDQRIDTGYQEERDQGRYGQTEGYRDTHRLPHLATLTDADSHRNHTEDGREGRHPVSYTHL